MVVALFLVSLAMIVGGSMAAVFGWDIVLNERGWVMVIAGSVVAASGFLMLGLAAIVVRLGRIRRTLALIHDRIGRGEPGLSDHAALDPLVAIPPAVAATGEARDDGMDEVRPPLPAFMQPRDAEPELDLPPPEPRKPEIPAEPAKEAAAAAEPPPALPAADEIAPPAPKEPPAAKEPPLPEMPPPVTVVGTYNSGDNHYIMFSDGAIEAETPNGSFRFSSLDELKAFIAAEGAARAP